MTETVRFAADENFHADIVRGVLRRRPSTSIVRVQDTDIRGGTDPIVLEWAAREGRIVLTHDARTMTRYAYDRVRRGSHMPGIIEVRRSVQKSRAIADILLIAECSLPGEWEGQVIYLPL